MIDVTHDNHGKVEGEEEEGVDGKKDKKNKKDKKDGADKDDEKKPTNLIALPKHLLQFEVRIPTEDKDLYTYYYLLKVRSFLEYFGNFSYFFSFVH